MTAVNKIFYYANLALIPLLFLMYFVSACFKLLKQAFQQSIYRTKTDYESHRRYCKMD